MTATTQPNPTGFSLPPAHCAPGNMPPTALGLLVGAKAALYTLAPAITGSAACAIAQRAAVEQAQPTRQRPELARRKQ